MKTIQLTQGMIAIVDDEDFERLNQFKWRAGVCSRNWEAIRQTSRREVKRQYIRMHRVIMSPPKELQVDHIHRDDENGVIDNRKTNLRLATAQQNSQNRRQRVSSKRRFVGVRPPGNRSVRWKAEIEIEGKKVHLGLFEDEIDAACAYDAAARLLHGEFAHTNFPYIFVV